MKPGLQRRHLLMWLLIGPAALVIFVLALLWRVPAPVQQRPAGVLETESSISARQIDTNERAEP